MRSGDEVVTEELTFIVEELKFKSVNDLIDEYGSNNRKGLIEAVNNYGYNLNKLDDAKAVLKGLAQKNRINDVKSILAGVQVKKGDDLLGKAKDYQQRGIVGDVLQFIGGGINSFQPEPPPPPPEKSWFEKNWVFLLGGAVVLVGGYLYLNSKKK